MSSYLWRDAIINIFLLIFVSIDVLVASDDGEEVLFTKLKDKEYYDSRVGDLEIISMV